MASLGNFFLGTPNKIEQVSRFTPDIMAALQPKLMQALQGIGNQEELAKGFDPFEKRAMSQFNQQIVPGLAERFTSLGSNSLSSPAFASQLGAAGAQLSEGLAGMRSQYAQNQEQNLMNLLQLGQMENMPVQGDIGFAGSFGPMLLKMLLQGGLGALSGALMGGPGGALVGGLGGAAAPAMSRWQGAGQGLQKALFGV